MHPDPAADPIPHRLSDEGRVHRPMAVGAVAFALVLVVAGASLGRLAPDRIRDTIERSAQRKALERVADTTERDARYRAGLAAARVAPVEAAARAVVRHLQRLGPESVDDSPAPMAFEPLTGYRLPGFSAGPQDVVGVSPDPEAATSDLSALAWRALALSDVLRTARLQVPHHARLSVWVRGEGLVVHPAVPAETFTRWLAPHAGFGAAAISPLDPGRAGWLPPTVGPSGRHVLPHVVPLLDERAQPWAVVRCDVDLDQLLDGIGLDVADGADLQPLVLDHRGEVLAAAPGVGLVLGLSRDESHDLAKVRAALVPFVGEGGFLLPDRDGIRQTGERAVFAGIPVEGIDWTVGVVAPRSLAGVIALPVALDAERATKRLGIALLGFSGLFALLAALTGIGFAYALRRRLERLAAVAWAHAAGDTDLRAPCDGDDEIGAVAMALNATALRGNETVRRLRESRRRLSGLIENMSEALVVTDSDDRVTFANARFCTILQRPASSLLGHFLEEFLVPQSLDVHRSQLKRRRVGANTRFEVTWRHGSGTHPQTLVASMPLFDADGRYCGSCAIVTDVSDRPLAQEESARAEKLRALGEMAGGVAHDFNNVLTAVLGNAQYLLSEVVDDDVRETLRVIETAALDGTETVNRIRKFTKPSAGVSDAGPVDPNAAAHDVLRMARPKFERVAQQSGVRYEVTLLREARRRIRGNASELREVLLNLAFNALEAMPDGGALTVETFDRGEDCVGLRVTDTGRGISEEHLDKVFDPFFSTKRGGRCSGLGLSICFGIVRAHGGRIEVRSEPGIGTTFTVVLPAFTGTGADAPEEPQAPTTPPDPRVLLVSTRQGSARAIRRGLNVGGLHVAHVGDPRIALDLLGDVGIFNTLVVEHDLGEHRGWDVARAARRLRPDLRIVLMVDAARPVDDSQVRNAGIDRALRRPFDSEDVRSVILAVLARPPARLQVDGGPAASSDDAERPPQLRETWGASRGSSTQGDVLTVDW